jgi:hypothetical protein
MAFSNSAVDATMRVIGAVEVVAFVSGLVTFLGGDVVTEKLQAGAVNAIVNNPHLAMQRFMIILSVASGQQMRASASFPSGSLPESLSAL